MISVGMIRDVWAFKDFMWSSVKREFQSRWTGTQIGPFWVIFHPLANILIFTVIFAEIMRPSLPDNSSKFAYSIYLCSGVLTWNLFSEMLARSVSIFVDNSSLLKKVHFPKLCLPIIVLLSNIVNFTIIMSIFIAFLVIIDAFPGGVVLSALPVLALQLGFSAGLGVLLATINVFYRDVQQTVQIVLQFWFWLTPIVYIPSNIPKAAQSFFDWNPMWPLIQAYQGIFLKHASPEWNTLLYPVTLTVLFLFLGVFAFHKLQGEIVDEL